MSGILSSSYILVRERDNGIIPAMNRVWGNVSESVLVIK